MSNDINKSESLVLLARQRRRLLLHLLRDSNTPIPMTELAKRIQECEYDDPVSGDLMSIKASLHHNHLPKLDASDAVEYNDSERTVGPGQNFGTLIHLLEKAEEAMPPHSDR